MSKYTEAVDRGLHGMIGVSTGTCPGCEQCASNHGFDPEDPASMRNGDTYEGGSFSWCSCGICGTTLGGERHVWHWVSVASDGTRTIEHESDACTDCVLYLANGDLPEAWRRTASDDPEDSAKVDNPGRY